MLKEAERGTDLSKELKAWRRKGMSFDDIADLLSLQGATVHGSTVVRWAREAEIE